MGIKLKLLGSRRGFHAQWNVSIIIIVVVVTNLIINSIIIIKFEKNNYYYQIKIIDLI